MCTRYVNPRNGIQQYSVQQQSVGLLVGVHVHKCSACPRGYIIIAHQAPGRTYTHIHIRRVALYDIILYVHTYDTDVQAARGYVVFFSFWIVYSE